MGQEGEMPSRSEIFRSTRTDKAGRPMNAAVGAIFEQLDRLGSESTDTSGPHDHLSQVLGPEHAGRVRCRLGQTPTGHWSEASSSSHATGGFIRQEQLDAALADAAQARQEAVEARQRADEAQQRADEARHMADQTQRSFGQLQNVMSGLVTQLSATFSCDLSVVHQALASIPVPVYPPPAAAPSGPPQTAPFGPPTAPSGGPLPDFPGPSTVPPGPAADDEILGDEDVDSLFDF